MIQAKIWTHCNWLRGTVVERQTLPVLHSTCSWWVTTYVDAGLLGKLYKVSQLGLLSLSSFRGR